MSMQHYASYGYPIPLNEDTATRLGLLEEFKKLESAVEADGGGWGFASDDIPEAQALLEAFKAKYGIEPEYCYVNDESEGLDGIESDTAYLVFSDEDKYVQTVSPAWEKMVEALPKDLEPTRQSWTVFG